MKYQLKDICSITKGATGIMKAIPGEYPLVALSDERRSHSEFQFDANAVIVPLISSTGHGHASMKRVHYQEGKFALGNILCAVIPNDETQLNAKYLHLYLQQFKETLLVPLMKGAANVSLPMNKLADVEIEVPSLERQLEIIALEDEAAEYKNDLEERLIAQDGDVAKLRQALLREAMQGKLTKQDAKDGNGIDLLKKIKGEQKNLIEGKKLNKPKSFLPIHEVEVQFNLPKNWICCRLGEAVRMIYGDSLTKAQCKTNGKYPVYGSNGIVGYYDKFLTEKKTIIIGRKGSAGALNICKVPSWTTDVAYYVEESENFNFDFLFYLLKSLGLENLGKGIKPGVNREAAYNIPIPLPPLPEQNRIVKKLEQFMQLCDELQYSIQQSKIENEKLLQGALRDALRKKEETKIISLPALQSQEEKHFLKRKVLATFIINQSLNDSRFGDVKFEKILHLSDYFAIKRNLGQKYYQQAAGPYDNAFTLQYFRQIEQSKWFSRKKRGSQYSFVTGQNHSKSTNTYGYFTDEELNGVKKLINYFKNSDYEQPEIISTLYAVWNNRIIRQQLVADDLLQQDFLEWDIQKVKYKDRLDAALQWMRKEGVIPDGWGKIIEKAKGKK